jgi:hypothetical protein
MLAQGRKEKRDEQETIVDMRRDGAGGVADVGKL